MQGPCLHCCSRCPGRLPVCPSLYVSECLPRSRLSALGTPLPSAVCTPLFFPFFLFSFFCSCSACSCSASTLLRPVLEEREHFLDVSVERFKPNVSIPLPPPPDPSMHVCRWICLLASLPNAVYSVMVSRSRGEARCGLLPSPA